MNKYFIGLGLIILVVIFFINKKYNLIDFISYNQKINAITYSAKDVNSIENGTYKGEYDAIYIRAKVKVVVKDKKITEIDLEEYYHDRGKGAENIVDEIIRSQKVDVDTIAGVTNSSMVIKKAVDNALFNGKKHM
ncbi:FMN-binding protein [Fusobacterium sp. PH5-44]|uniref:FMN-binding protein n=1 Tax=unclassified Fusobacterium TaxID=2648384 RepID=UPI003D1DD6FF